MKKQPQLIGVFAVIAVIALAALIFSGGKILQFSITSGQPLESLTLPLLANDQFDPAPNLQGSDYVLGYNAVSGKYVLNGAELKKGSLSGVLIVVQTPGTGLPSFTFYNYSDPVVTVQKDDIRNSYTLSGSAQRGGTTFKVFETNPRMDWDLQGCSLQPGEMLFATTLRGGETTSIPDLSRLAPVKKFCARLGAVVTDDNANSRSDTQIYYDLLSSSNVIVPASRTYTVFWVTDQNPQVFFKCGENFAYDSQQLACVPTTGFAYACPQGATFKDGKCLVQPEVFCPAQTTFNGTICVAPQVIDCKRIYGANSTYKVVNGVGLCETMVPANYTCGSLQGTLVSSYQGTPGQSPWVCQVIAPTQTLTAPPYYDCSSYGSSARYNGSNCVVIPDYSPSATRDVGYDWLVVLAALLIGVVIVLAFRGAKIV